MHSETGALLREDKERCLERVLGIVIVADYAAADAKHHCAVAIHQGCKGRFGGLVATASEVLEELTIRHTRHNAHIEESLEVSQGGFAVFVWQV